MMYDNLSGRESVSATRCCSPPIEEEDDPPYDRCPFCAPLIAALAVLTLIGIFYGAAEFIAAVVEYAL